MLSLLRKKKLTEEKVANIFVNSILQSVDEGFPEIAAMINEDPEFESQPSIAIEASDQFLLIVIAGNLKFIPNHFNNYQDIRLIDQITGKLAFALGIEKPKMQETIAQYQSYLSRVNHPSKNTLYAMSKATFFKYNLNQYQQDYFRDRNSPNPIFLKRLDEALAHFLWDWEEFQKNYKVTE